MSKKERLKKLQDDIDKACKNDKSHTEDLS